MINSILRWFGSQKCRWLNRHTDILYSVGHNIGKECRYCKRHGGLTPQDIAEMKRFLGGEDEVAVEPPR
jgi:hypothetical protein